MALPKSLIDVLEDNSANGGLLFCGAGFLADCLNFDEKSLGVGGHLLQALNKSLGRNYRDLQLAADYYAETRAYEGLRKFLIDRYDIRHEDQSAAEIVGFPWDRIYTTNYDDLISQSLQRTHIRHEVFDILTPPHEAIRMAGSKQMVVHLHGARRNWGTLDTFEKTCILGRKSYVLLNDRHPWFDQLQQDFDRARFVVFLGFSNNDLHLTKMMHAVQGAHLKTFFVNRVDDAEDYELLDAQKAYGQSINCGREGLLEALRTSEATRTNNRRVLRSVRETVLPDVAPNTPTTQDQYDFIIFGRQNHSALLFDIRNESEFFRVQRGLSQKITEYVLEESLLAGKVAMLEGGIASGKSFILAEINQRLKLAGRSTFILDRIYDDVLSEVEHILTSYSNPVIILDDAFRLKFDDLRRIFEMIGQHGGISVMAARNRFLDDAPDVPTWIGEKGEYRTWSCDTLSSEEMHALARCSERQGIWPGQTRLSEHQKVESIRRDYRAGFASFLLGVFRSKVVRDRFRTAIDTVAGSGTQAEGGLILALYLRHLNVPVYDETLSRMLGVSAYEVLSGLVKRSPFLQYDDHLRSYETINAVNARDALSRFFLIHTGFGDCA
ncbi:SIR2 family protein [Gymnodinialimonas sp.]